MQNNWAGLLANLPTGLTIAQAARLLGRGYYSVRRHLIDSNYEWKDGRKLRFVFAAPKTRVNWSKLDWRQSNIAIARRYHVCREIVRRMRNRLNKPFVESRGAKPKKGKHHARKIQTSAKIHGHVRPQPRKGARQVPAQRSGARVLA